MDPHHVLARDAKRAHRCKSSPPFKLHTRNATRATEPSTTKIKTTISAKSPLFAHPQSVSKSADQSLKRGQKNTAKKSKTNGKGKLGKRRPKSAPAGGVLNKSAHLKPHTTSIYPSAAMLDYEPEVAASIRRSNMAAAMGVSNYMKFYLAELDDRVHNVNGNIIDNRGNSNNCINTWHSDSYSSRTKEVKCLDNVPSPRISSARTWKTDTKSTDSQRRPIHRSSKTLKLQENRYANIPPHASQTPKTLQTSGSECSPPNDQIRMCRSSDASVSTPRTEARRAGAMSNVARMALAKSYEEVILSCLKKKFPHLVHSLKTIQFFHSQCASDQQFSREDRDVCDVQVPFRSLDAIKYEYGSGGHESIMACIDDLNQWIESCEYTLAGRLAD